MTIQTKDRYVLAPAACLIQSACPFISIFNPSPSWKWVHKGDILGILHNPDEYFDEDNGGLQAETLKAYANVVQKLAKGSLNKQDMAEAPLGKPRASDIPPEPDGPDKLWGPKTSEPADPTTY